jgi:hypothetical protein
LSLKVKNLDIIQVGTKKIIKDVGILDKSTDIKLRIREGTAIQISGESKKGSSLFKQDFKFEDIGIGGLDD